MVLPAAVLVLIQLVELQQGPRHKIMRIYQIEKSIGLLNRLSEFMLVLVLVELGLENHFIIFWTKLLLLSLNASKELDIFEQFVLSIADLDKVEGLFSP